MSVYAVWDSHFPPEASDEGRELTEAIWRDMLEFDGYESHQLIEDLDDPGLPARRRRAGRRVSMPTRRCATTAIILER